MGKAAKLIEFFVDAFGNKTKVPDKNPTQKIFKKDTFVSKLEEGQAPSRGTLDVEGGKAGKITKGRKSMPTMQDALSLGSRERARLVSRLETLVEKGEANASQKSLLKRLDKLSKKADTERTKAATKTKQAEKSKEKGVSLAGEDGRIKAKPKPKLKDSDMMIGNTTNGITKDGEIIGKPTENQMQAVIRNLDARKKLSEDGKRNLAKLKRMSQKNKQELAIRKMERNMYDTGPDRKQQGGLGLKKPTPDQKGLKKLPTEVRNKMGFMKRGGLTKAGNMDMRKGGMFYK